MDTDVGPSCSTVPDNPTPAPAKLGNCEVCARKSAKYCCPRCEVKTCSLPCNKIHKLEFECSGIRDRAKFIPINKFTNLDLSSDFRLLEEISRVVEVSKKKRMGASNFGLNKRLLVLQQQALQKHINLKYLPKGFMRHKCNTSRVNFATKLIEWHIDWIFVNSESLKISDHRVPENTRLSVILHKYLSKQDNAELQEKLQYYQSADLPGIKILLKAEQKSGKKFYELDPTYTLGECLQNKIIIEYPTVHLVLKDQASSYDILDSDDEDSKEEIQKRLKSGHEVINKIIKRAESDTSLYESFKNLLFASEYTDEEKDSDAE